MGFKVLGWGGSKAISTSGWSSHTHLLSALTPKLVTVVVEVVAEVVPGAAVLPVGVTCH